MPLLRDASFELAAGGIYDLTGPSGAGKSTLLRACALVLARDGGELYLDEAPSSRARARRRRAVPGRGAQLVVRADGV
ncbi:ABC transporter ATP-binding protein, partial [Eggerthella sinensis]|uniref:ATP-binding cassette domain-containing protein n=1 Tax=Eggerthella sinensis TaxID=242230 RepID=UPI0022E06BF0